MTQTTIKNHLYEVYDLIMHFDWFFEYGNYDDQFMGWTILPLIVMKIVKLSDEEKRELKALLISNNFEVTEPFLCHVGDILNWPSSFDIHDELTI